MKSQESFIMDIESLRDSYEGNKLSIKDLHENPFKQLQIWIEEAYRSGEQELNAMALATATKEGKPSVRHVLLKKIQNDQVLFFTHYTSKKGKQIEENAFVAATLYWRGLHRQVCFEGRVKKAPRKISEDYFSSRPRESQLAAWAAHQDTPIPARSYLEEGYKDFDKKFANKPIPCPPYWGGYMITPTFFDFWQGRPNRLHDRFQYMHINKKKWKITRLSP